MTKLDDIIATGNRGWQAGPGQLMLDSHIECADGYRLSGEVRQYLDLDGDDARGGETS